LLKISCLFDFISFPLQPKLAALCLGQPSEQTGEVKGFSLLYSGNFLVEAEITEMGRLHFNMGIHPMGLQWNLTPGNRIDCCLRIIILRL
jgi:alpha-galactosidase